MIGFFGPTKLLPLVLDLAMLAAIFVYRFPVK